ncbi:MliC family protein [Lewinella sp. JB7]|uniref:MliC family protein n=1 Tax=Lewinella sp. JB7 TaxID=2962887 RepID=UPI0020C93A1C|nr:MliC family protein [Lewinella sp. JB7]MCP9237845.1 MliC family protein [Lewinella sp. JB7]
MFSNCQQAGTEEDAISSSIIHRSFTDARGNQLDLSFDNSRQTVAINFGGETAELASRHPASGFWYTDERYELRGKGDDLQLAKDGTVIFEHHGGLVPVRQ